MEHLWRVEHAVLVAALSLHGGNKNRAAKALKIGRTTMVEKCRRHGLPLQGLVVKTMPKVMRALVKPKGIPDYRSE